MTSYLPIQNPLVKRHVDLVLAGPPLGFAGRAAHPEVARRAPAKLDAAQAARSSPAREPAKDRGSDCAGAVEKKLHRPAARTKTISFEYKLTRIMIQFYLIGPRASRVPPGDPFAGAVRKAGWARDAPKRPCTIMGWSAGLRKATPARLGRSLALPEVRDAI